MRQPSIARLENGSSIPSLSFLDRIAKALDARIEVNFVWRVWKKSRIKALSGLEESFLKPCFVAREEINQQGSTGKAYWLVETASGLSIPPTRDLPAEGGCQSNPCWFSGRRSPGAGPLDHRHRFPGKWRLRITWSCEGVVDSLPGTASRREIQRRWETRQAWELCSMCMACRRPRIVL